MAVIGILCFHAGFHWAQGGFLGVSIFFTLSGFLITSLVVAERDQTGGVRPTAFWARRARRLVPASIAALLLATLVTVIAVPGGQRAAVAVDIRAALFQVANWRFIAKGTPYADLSVVPSPVQHYWSLGIEEQFYVVFPLLAMVTLRRRKAVLAGALTVAFAGSIAAQVLVHGADRVYFGTDTRAAELAAGGLLALAYPHLRDLPALVRRHLPDIGGLAALAVIVLLCLELPLQRPALYDGGLGAFAIVSVLLVLGAVEGPIVRRLIGVRPLVQLGRISYGVYLYHFPLYVLLDADRVGVRGYPLFVVRVAATLAVAAASSRYLERPIRSGARLVGPNAPRLALAGGLAAVLAVGIPVGNMRAPHLAFRTVAAPEHGGHGHGTSTTSSSTTVAAVGAATTTIARSTTTTLAPARPPRIVVVGDSTAAANGKGLADWGASTGRLQVVTVSEPGCGVLPGVRFTVRQGYVFTPQGCDTLFSRAASTAQSLDADAIVVFIGSAQLADWEYADLQGEHHLGEPLIDGRFSTALQLALQTLSTAGRPVLWATVPTPDWNLDVYAQEVGTPIPGSGPITLNDPARTVRINQLDGPVVPAAPLATLWPYATKLELPDGSVPLSIRPDGLHLSEAGVAQIANDWLFDALASAYRSVTTRAPGGLAPVERQSWSAPGAPLG